MSDVPLQSGNGERSISMTIKYTRNGGIRFLRIGRIQLSFCICKPKAWVMPEILDLNQLPEGFKQRQRLLLWTYGNR
jgi:hypothetical protein